MRSEKKGIDVTQSENYSNLVITCNDYRVLRMEHRQRRYALFDCSDRYVGNTAYFDALRAHMDKPSVARSFYQHLMSLGPIETNFQATRPQTAFFKSVMEDSIPPIGTYLSARINSGLRTGDLINTTEVKAFIGRLRADDPSVIEPGSRTLAKEIKNYKGLDEAVAGGAAFRVINVDALKAHLERTFEYSGAATL